MRAEPAPERRVQQMGRRMMRPEPGAPRRVHPHLQQIPERDRAGLNRAQVNDQIARVLLGIGDFDRRPAAALQHSAIADLAARLGVERGLVDDDRNLAPRLRALRLPAPGNQPDHLRTGRQRGVAEELGGADALAEVEPERRLRGVARSGPALAGLLPLALHRRVEPGGIDRAALAAQHILGQVERKTVGVVKTERDVARQPLGRAETGGLVGEQLEAAVEHFLEPRFLVPQGLGDQRLGALELGESAPHLRHQGRHELPHQGLSRPHDVGVPHRPAHDAPQHIAAALVRRQHPVGDQEARRAHMVGDHPVGDPVLAIGVGARALGRGLDQRPQHVGRIVVVRALQEGRDPLQPHPGIDARPGQRDPLAGAGLVELHEDEVPDLDEPVAVLVRAARRPARDMVAMVVEDLRARPARPGLAHRPEIVAGGDPENPLLAEAGDLAPQIERLVVVDEDGDQQPVLGHRELARDQRPGEVDRGLLEVVAEGEIAQHLEERLMARGVADILKIVVLAAGAHAFLRGHRAGVVPRLHPGEDVLELHHAGIDEQQGRIVLRHQRRRGDHRMPVGGKVVQERAAQIVGAEHDRRRHPPLPGRPHGAAGRPVPGLSIAPEKVCPARRGGRGAPGSVGSAADSPTVARPSIRRWRAYSG